MEDARLTFREIAVGILLMAGIYIIAGIWLVDNRLSYVAGVLFGSAGAVALLAHMYKSLDEGLDLDPDSAGKYIKRKSIMRLVMMGLVVMASGFFPRIFHPIGVVLGVLGLKFAAYLQPLVHKYIFKKKENE